MPAGRLEFGTLNLSLITNEDEGVEVFSTPYILFDGRTIVAGVSETGERPSFRGVAKGESFVTAITNKIGSRYNLTVNDKAFGLCQIIDFDYNYDRYNGLQNIYKFKLDFAKENLS